MAVFALSILLLLSFLASIGMWIIYFTHMFQLNSYKMRVQSNWMLKNFKSIVPKWLLTLLVIPLLVTLQKSGLTIAAVLFIILAYVNRPEKEPKKPLVYTGRVKRLLATAFALILASAAAAFIFREQRLILAAILTISYILTPFILLIANVIIMPAEKLINRKYIIEAKKMIDSASSLKVIGVTGSYGKTSVKYFLTKLVSSKYDVLMTPESYNTTLGVVRTVREKLRATHELFVCEMGARNVGDIKEICDLVHPKYGVITSIGNQHLESFKTVENIKKTKFELADSLPDDGIAFLNAEDENIKSVGYKRRSVTYGLDGRGDYTAFDISLDENGTAFTVKAPNGETERYSTNIIGRHNVLNITGAIAVANTLSVPLSDLKMPVRKLESVPHRLQLIKNGENLIIDDAYNSNPEGAGAALSTLAMFNGCKVLVTPGMVELGAKQDECNREFGQQAAGVCDYAVLVGKKQTESIMNGLTQEGFDNNRIFVVDTIQEAFSVISNIKKSAGKKIILLENDLPDNF